MTFASCTKESVSPTGTAAANAVNVTPRVQAFVAAANDPARSKSNGTFSTDSAIWYLEAGLNYSTAQAWQSFNELAVDSVLIPLDLSSGSVSEAAVFEAYQQLATLLADVNTEEQHLYLVDVVEPNTASTAGEVLVY